MSAAALATMRTRFWRSIKVLELTKDETRFLCHPTSWLCGYVMRMHAARFGEVWVAECGLCSTQFHVSSLNFAPHMRRYVFLEMQARETSSVLRAM